MHNENSPFLSGGNDEGGRAVFFNSWYSLLRILIVGTLAYVALIMLLRGSGKRTLAKLNAFDLVVTVSLGSLLATILLSQSVSLAEGIVALSLLIGLQYLVAWLSVRWTWFSGLVKSEPTLLLHHGLMLNLAMRQQRVTREELVSAVRAAGLAELSDAAAVVLETDGSLSVIPAAAAGSGAIAVLDGVKG